MSEGGVCASPKGLLAGIQNVLNRKPEMCDVTFSVGPDKKLVKCLKVILMAASPVLEKEFEDKWEVAVVKEGEGIPLPDFDPDAFELFVNLTTLDTWSVEALSELNLLPNQLLSLLLICRRFGMDFAVKSLETLVTTFAQSFSKFADSEEFLGLFQANLREVLASDDLAMKEVDVYASALRWAESRCKEQDVEATMETLRQVLGDCLFEIRFTIMSVVDFTNVLEIKTFLTDKEIIGIYKYIGLEEIKRLNFDKALLPFKTHPRKKDRPDEPQPPDVPSDCLTLSLMTDSEVTDGFTFVCDGTSKTHWLKTKQNIQLVGFRFLGPIDTDSFYDVTVQVERDMKEHKSWRTTESSKRVYALKGCSINFICDKPIILEVYGKTDGDWTNSYTIKYTLKGPTTPGIQRKVPYQLLEEAGNRLVFKEQSKQLSHILFRPL